MICYYKKKKKHTNVKQLPFLTEDLLLKNYYNNCTNKNNNTLEYKTSGTTSGSPKKILFSHEDHATYVKQRAYFLHNHFNKKCNNAAFVLGRGHVSDSLCEIFNLLKIDAKRFYHNQHINFIIKNLNKLNPDILYTMPAVLDVLISTKNLKISPKKICIGGDVATAIWKQNVCDFFNLKTTDLLDIFGSTEIGNIAYFDHSLKKYKFCEHIFPEIIEPNVLFPNIKHANTEAKILVLTSFSRMSFPAIRYVTYDLICGFKKIERNNKQIYIFDKCIGRIGSEFKHGVRISMYDIEHAVNKIIPNTLFSISDNEGKLKILIHKNDITKTQIENIRKHILNTNNTLFKMIKAGSVNDIIIEASNKNLTESQNIITAKRYINHLDFIQKKQKGK